MEYIQEQVLPAHIADCLYMKKQGKTVVLPIQYRSTHLQAIQGMLGSVKNVIR